MIFIRKLINFDTALFNRGPAAGRAIRLTVDRNIFYFYHKIITISKGVGMKTDVLVIGGSAAGLVAAMTCKSNYPEKDVTVIRREDKVMIPCGIPYIYGTVG